MFTDFYLTDRFLVHIHPDTVHVIHRGRSFLRRDRADTQNLLQLGHPFYIASRNRPSEAALHLSGNRVYQLGCANRLGRVPHKTGKKGGS
jgi:hypothetical protein